MQQPCSPLIPVHLHSDALDIAILPLGAALVGVRWRGERRNHVLGFADPQNHPAVPIYAGAIVGPVANRVRGGQVRIGQEVWQMPCNEKGQTTLHSGPDGLHAQIWQVAERSDNLLVLDTSLADGVGGLPGNRQFRAVYEVTHDTLRLTLTARTDRATPINLAAHPYWTLDGAPDVAGHRLQVHAQRYLPTDAANLPTGELAPVADTCFDYRTARAVALSPALDVNFCLADGLSSTPRPAARLTGSTGTTLEIETTAPGLQVYSGAFLPKMPDSLADGPALAPYAAIALEPQHWPDAPHHGHFPQIILHPDMTYTQISNYRLTTP